MRYTAPTLISLGLHLCLLMLMVSGNGSAGKSNGTEQVMTSRVPVKIIPKAQTEEIKKTTPPDNEGKVLIKKKKKKPQKKQKKQKKVECKYYYEGIGVHTTTHRGLGCTITEVFKGYAADNNDIKVGDLIVGIDCDTIRGPEGTTIQLKIMRGIQVINKSFKREKICEDRSSKP